MSSSLRRDMTKKPKSEPQTISSSLLMSLRREFRLKLHQETGPRAGHRGLARPPTSPFKTCFSVQWGLEPPSLTGTPCWLRSSPLRIHKRTPVNSLFPWGSSHQSLRGPPSLLSSSWRWPSILSEPFFYFFFICITLHQYKGTLRYPVFRPFCSGHNFEFVQSALEKHLSDEECRWPIQY